MAIAFAREGADVAFTYLPEEASDAKATNALVIAEDRKCVPIEADLRTSAECARAVVRGGRRTGRASTFWSTTLRSRWAAVDGLADVDDERLERIMNTNLLAAFRMTRAALPHLRVRGIHHQHLFHSGVRPFCCAHRLRSNQGGTQQLHSESRRGTWTQRHPRKRRCPWTHLDSVATGNSAAGEDRELRHGHAAWTRGSASGGRTGVRIPRFRGGRQLRLWHCAWSHRRPARLLAPDAAATPPRSSPSRRDQDSSRLGTRLAMGPAR